MRKATNVLPLVTIIAIIAVAPRMANAGLFGQSITDTVTDLNKVLNKDNGKCNLPSATEDATLAAEERAKYDACNKCLTFLNNAKKDIPSKANAIAARDVSLADTSVSGVQAAASNVKGPQDNSFLGMKFGSNDAQIAKGQQATNAGDLNALLKQCQTDANSNCDMAPLQGTAVRQRAEQVFKACGTGAAAAATKAGLDSKDSLNLGDLAKTMGASAQMLGAAAQLAQLANQQNAGGQSASDPNAGLSGGQFGATSPSGSSINGGASSGPETTSLSSGASGANPTKIALGVNPNAAKAGAASSAGPYGSNYNTNHMADGVQESGASSTGASTGAGRVAAGSVGGGGVGGGGIGNSTGSSRMGGDAGRGPASGGGVASGTGGASYEIAGTGGVTNRALMMGIKPGSGELNDLTAGAALPASEPALDALGNAGGADARAAEAEAESSDSVFLRIHSRYAVLAKKGRF